MQVETTRHNIYSYLRQTGEIVPGALADTCYLWEFNPFEQFSSMPEVEMFVLGITEQCNLRCTYCCYSGEYKSNRTHSSHSMRGEDIDVIYNFIKRISTKSPLRIAFYGGEPLTNYNVLQYAIEKAANCWGNEVTFSVTTNGTLLTEEKVDWLIAHNVELQISIDGTAPFHDSRRIDISGNGSFSRMYQALSYIAVNFPEHLHKVQLLMTLPSIEKLPDLAKEWNDDNLLKHIAPSHITGLAPNFATGVTKKDYDTLRVQYLDLLDAYENHQDWLVMKAFFEECVAYWKDRPIMDVDGPVPMSTCMPRNTKLFIDSNKQIAVCEKISDNYRLGNVKDGINWNRANEHVQSYYNKRVHRCSRCPAIRVCDLCLTTVEFDEEQWDVLCHNERVYAQLYMLLFCEMVERGMIV